MTRSSAISTLDNKVLRLRRLWARFGTNEARSQSVYETLRAAILGNVLSEMEPLRERWLSEALQVSRTPVREALQRLKVEGFVRDVPGWGLVVSKFTLQDIEEIYSVRARLEGMAAELAARMATPSSVSLLEELQGEIERALRRRDFERAAWLSRQFHEALCRIGKNERLTQLVMLLYDTVQRISSTTLRHPGRAAQAIKEHRGMLDAIKRGDAEAARRFGEEHVEGAKRMRLALSGDGSFPVAPNVP